VSIVTWTDFEKNNSNIKKDFEDMCRVFFNIKFFNGDAIFTKSPNHPGVEIEPIKCGDKFISFQSKHFGSTTSYSEIEDSISKATKHYGKNQLI